MLESFESFVGHITGDNMSTGYKVNPPELEECKNFDVYLKQLKVWKATTPAPAEKHGAIIASTLPNNSKKYKADLQDKFYEQVDSDKLITKEGLDLVISFLKKELGEQDLDKVVRVWEEFEDCVRGTKNIDAFISDFERAYNNVTVTSSTAVLPEEVRAFMLLRRSGLNSTQRMLVLSQLDHEKVDNMFENMSRIIKVVVGSVTSSSKSMPEPIKLEADPSEDGVFLASDGRKYIQKRSFYNNRNRGAQGGGHASTSRKPYDNKPRENKKDESGEVTRCRTCDSKYHYQNNCEIFKMMQERKTGEKKTGEEAHVTEVCEEEIDFALAAEHREDLSEFTKEAMNCAALDTCCTSSVAGEVWLKMYREELEKYNLASKIVGPSKSNKIFRFGNSGKLPSLGKYTIPAFLAGKRGTLEIDIVGSDLPLLLSKKAMKGAGMKINMVDDTAELLGRTVKLMTTCSGHYCLPLLEETASTLDLEWALSVDLSQLSEKEQKQKMEKLHKQFGHYSKAKFLLFMKDAKAEYAGMEKHIDEIIQRCEGCLLKNSIEINLTCMAQAKGSQCSTVISEIKVN